MKSKTIVIVLAVVILLIGINYEYIFEKEYSIKDVKESNFKDNRTNDTFVSIELPDETEIITNTITNNSIIMQPAGISIWLAAYRGVGIRFRDGNIYGDWNWKSSLREEDKTIQKSYMLNNVKIVESGKTLILPDNTQIYLGSKKTLIRLKSKILILKGNNNGDFLVILSDGNYIKHKGKDWFPDPILPGQDKKIPIYNIRYGLQIQEHILNDYI